ERRPDDEPSEAAKARKKPTAQKPTATTARAGRTVPTAILQPDSIPIQQRSYGAFQVRQATGLEQRGYYYGQQQQRAWAPDDFGQARLAALGWLLAFAQKENRQDAFLKERRTAAERAGADLRAQWDWYYLQILKQDARLIYEAARPLAS